jgi:hypothetical protein
MKRNLARTTMKRILSGFLAFAVLAALTIVTTTSKYTVHRVYAQSGCSLATLTGNYAFSQPGFTPKNAMGNPLPIAVVGVSTFDGAGNVSATFTDMSPGKPTYIAVQGTGSGTYTVNSDCTGSASFTSGSAAGETLNMVIIGGGTEVFGINTTPFVIATADFKKQ